MQMQLHSCYARHCICGMLVCDHFGYCCYFCCRFLLPLNKRTFAQYCVCVCVYVSVQQTIVGVQYMYASLKPYNVLNTTVRPCGEKSQLNVPTCSFGCNNNRHSTISYDCKPCIYIFTYLCVPQSAFNKASSYPARILAIKTPDYKKNIQTSFYTYPLKNILEFISSSYVCIISPAIVFEFCSLSCTFWALIGCCYTVLSIGVVVVEAYFFRQLNAE